MEHQHDLIALLGQSALSPAFESFKSNFIFTAEAPAALNYQGYIYLAVLRDSNKGIFLEFCGHRLYKEQFGEPDSVINTDNDELILKEITIDNLYYKTKIEPKIGLPFNLRFGDNKEMVIAKLNKKPAEKSETTYGYAWWFMFDNFRMLATLNHEYKLIWIRLMRLTTAEIKKKELKKELARQNKAIIMANASMIPDFIQKLPTIEWRKRKEQGDETFTDKAINQAETILTGYLQILSMLTQQQKAAGIYNSVRKIVMAFNRFNEKNNGVIETIEREEICDFINSVVRTTGLPIEEGIDLTAEWREW